MSLLLGFVSVVVAWAVLLRTVLFGCTAAFTGVMASFTAVLAVANAAGLLVLTACGNFSIENSRSERLVVLV